MILLTLKRCGVVGVDEEYRRRRGGARRRPTDTDRDEDSDDDFGHPGPILYAGREKATVRSSGRHQLELRRPETAAI